MQTQLAKAILPQVLMLFIATQLAFTIMRTVGLRSVPIRPVTSMWQAAFRQCTATPPAIVIQPSELMPLEITAREAEISDWETQQGLSLLAASTSPSATAGAQTKITPSESAPFSTTTPTSRASVESPSRAARL